MTTTDGLQLYYPAENLAKSMLGEPENENMSTSFKFSMTNVHHRLSSSSKPFEEKFHDKHIQEEFFTLANKMRLANILTDVELVADNRIFPAHRLILSIVSEYFKKMFSGSLATCERRINLVDVSSDMAESILTYIYTGSITLNEDNIQDVLDCAGFLFLPRLRERCGKFLRDRLDRDNCLKVFHIAKRYSLPYLLECSCEFISAIFQDIVTHPDFQYLSVDELTDIFCMEDLSVPSEDFVLEAAMLWLRYDVIRRERDFPEVLKCIHLPYVSDFLLKQFLDNDVTLRNNTTLQNMFQSALRLTLNNWSTDQQNFQLLEPKQWCSPRKCIQCIPTIITMGGPTLNLFNSELGKWCEVTRCKPRHCPGMDVIGSCIYIVGGSLQWKRKVTGEYFNTETNEWLNIAPMHTARSNFGLVHLGGKLYALGGYDGNFPLTSAECYSPETDSWNVISDLNCARDGACNISDGESVYVIGGYDGNKYLLSTEIYQPETDKWDILSISPMHEKRQNAMCAYFDNRIYIVGGYYDNIYHASMEVLDLETNEWSYLSPLSEPRHHAGASAVNGHVFVCGGWSANIPVSYVDVYSIENDTWQRVAPLPTPTMIRSVAVNFPRKSMLNLFNDKDEEMIASRSARLKKLRSISECSSSGNDSQTSYLEGETAFTSSIEET